jgi:hypothetical protein
VSAFDEFRDAVVEGAAQLARDVLHEGIRAARADAGAFLEEARADFERWTNELAAGELTQKQFASLVRGQADLAKLFALAQAGIGAARLQRFRDGLIDLVIREGLRVFLP